MRQEFQIGLAIDANLKQIRDELKETARKQCNRLLARIDNDYLSAQLIRQGLSAPSGSPARKIADAYVESFRQQYEPEIRKQYDIAENLMQSVGMTLGDLDNDLNDEKNGDEYNDNN